MIVNGPMKTTMQSAFRLTCPEGRRFAVALAVSGDRSAEVSRFLHHAVRVLVCQSMSCAAAIDTLDMVVRHYFNGFTGTANALVIECDDDGVRWCSAGDIEALHVASPTQYDRLTSCGAKLGCGERGGYDERTFEPLRDGILALAAPSNDIERLLRPIVQSLLLGVRPDSMYFHGALLMKTPGRYAPGLRDARPLVRHQDAPAP